MARLYPDEPLLAGGLDDEDRLVSYGVAREEEMIAYCGDQLARFVPAERLYPCVPPRPAATPP